MGGLQLGQLAPGRVRRFRGHMRKMLEFQADRIETVLAQHKAPGRVTGGTVTPRWVRFQFLPALGSRISKIRGLAEELATALDAPNVRIARQGAAVQIEVPRENPQPVRLLPLMEGLRDVPPVTAVLGLAEDGAPLLIRLPSPDVAHILVAGTTGSGKTALLRTMVVSLALRHPRRAEMLLVLIDPKGRAFADMAPLPQLSRPVVVRVEEAVETLASLVRLMERRDRMADNAPPVVVGIDELTDLMMVGGARAERELTRLLQRGREAGIHVVAATQKPTAAVIGSLVKANFPVRLVGKVTSAEDARVASGWRGSGAERLLGRGDFVAVAEGQLLRFQAAYVDPAEVAQVATMLHQGGAILPLLTPGGRGEK
ncbi:MAG: DNA translocase FtsK [Anaerolineae bacterium]|nr:DNA translocase FtsK [Anaerolineae bacterium]